MTDSNEQEPNGLFLRDSDVYAAHAVLEVTGGLPSLYGNLDALAQLPRLEGQDSACFSIPGENGAFLRSELVKELRVADEMLGADSPVGMAARQLLGKLVAPKADYL